MLCKAHHTLMRLCRGPSFDAPDGADVRAPLPVMRDRLYGADFSMLGRPRGHSRRENEVDAFRDFRCAQEPAAPCLMA